ncbi:MAG: peptidase U32 family protein [Armatimonadota bacterium]
MAAIDCGADAVYIGAPRFGARENAGNPLQDIEALVRHAHTYWAKVYITVNTLLRDDELPQAVKLIHNLYELGVDGLIIQDVGLLECDLPPLPLIASTQMHNQSPERVAFLEQVGFQRAILAREMSLEQIKEIRQQTKIELECFIHGALCVGYSGQCYLSYGLGGRSGNRGQCAQPCRKCYSLVDNQGTVLVKDRHLLSLRDLNLTDHLRDLIQAGVCSFKIEGRLKDKAYIMNVVSHYRAALDAVLTEEGLRKSSSGAGAIDFTPDPGKTFNRGYSSYFMLGRGAEIASPDTPKMVGEEIGTVLSTTPRSFTLESDIPLHNGDGICFFDINRELRGTTINGVQGNTITPGNMLGIEKGMQIYRNHDHEFHTKLAKSKPVRQIGVAMTLIDTPEGVSDRAVDEDGNIAEFTLPCEKALAEKPDQARENIRKQLAKTGGTAFTCTDITIDLPTAYFLPVSILNALRRGVLEALEAVRVANRPVGTGGAFRNDVPFPKTNLTFRGNVLNQQADAFYRRHGVTRIEPAAETGLDMRGRTVMITKHCLKHQLGLCPKAGEKEQINEPLTLLDAEGHRLELRFDCAKCEMAVLLKK